MRDTEKERKWGVERGGEKKKKKENATRFFLRFQLGPNKVSFFRELNFTYRINAKSLAWKKGPAYIDT